jgi:hypothetical protein
LFGQKALKRAGFSVPANPKAFNFGCQGPDFLLYHNFYPWKRDSRVSNLGNAIHKRHCGPFLMDLIQAGLQHVDMQEYIQGFVTHHILDRWTHPYIIYRSGDGKYKHQELEIIIDTILALRLEKIRTWKEPVTPHINLGKRLPRSWVRVMKHTARKHFPREAGSITGRDWQRAYRNMLHALRLFFDPYGIKLILTMGAIRPFRYKKPSPSVDYLNESLHAWVHPALPQERHRESFWSLWEKALNEAGSILRTVQACWQGENQWTLLKQQIGNLSYDTGKDCEANLLNKAYDPIV